MSAAPPTTEILPPGKWEWPSLRQLYTYRELLYVLTWRDIRVLYKQTVIGAPWAILQPLIMMVIYTVIFGVVLKVPSNGVPFTLFIFVGLLAWNFFSLGASRAASSIIGNAGLIRKIYFPHLLLPISSVMSGIADFIPTLVLTIVLGLAYGYLPSINYLLLIPALALLFVTTLGFSIWFSALNAQYRDVVLIVPLLMQVLFYLTPVIYSSQMFGETWRVWMGIFPMTTVVETFRWIFIGGGTDPLSTTTVLLSWISAFVVLISGLLYFQRADVHFVDLV